MKARGLLVVVAVLGIAVWYLQRVSRVGFFVVSAVALLGAGVGAGIWYLTKMPFYRPGMVRHGKSLRSPLVPPLPHTDSDGRWKVEPDISLHHFAEGSGQHSAVVIHGGPGLPFRQPMSGLGLLTSRYRFHYFDQRGCGKSTRPFDSFRSKNIFSNMVSLDKTLGLGSQIADVERIRCILSEEKLVLIGHSWGAFLASLYAAEFPDRVAALVLVSPASVLEMPTRHSDLFAAVRARLPSADLRSEFDAFMKDYLNFKLLFNRTESQLVDLNMKFGQYYMSVLNARKTASQGEPGGWMVWAMYVSMGQRYDYRAALRKVTAPVLVIHGAKDIQPESASREYTQVFTNAKLAVLDDSTHFSFEEQPREFAQVVGEFLASSNL